MVRRDPTTAETRIVLRPSPRKWLGVFAITATFTGIGVWMAGDGRPGAWAVTAFFGACALLALLMLLPRATYLEVREDGFAYRHLFRGKSYAWSEVGPFSTASLGSGSMVVFDRLGATPTRLARASAALAGANHGLPDTYGLDAGELALLMNRTRERALGRGDGR